MKKIITAVILLVSLGGGIYYIASSQQSKVNQSSTVTTGPKLYDVRTAAEYDVGHIDGAINLDVAAIQEGKFPDVDKNTAIAVYCRSGRRAGEAKSLLEKEGFTNVTNYGSVESVVERGYKLVK